MRLAFAGCSGTGKSHLTKYVAEKYGLSVCPVGSRSVAKAMGFENPYDVDKAGMRATFQRRLFVEKLQWEADHEDFVTDRTAFDNLAYATMHGVKFTMAELAEYANAMQRYLRVVFLPRRYFQDLSEDPVRVQEFGYHEVFDMVLTALLVKYDVASAVSCEVVGEARLAAVDSLIAGGHAGFGYMDFA